VGSYSKRPAKTTSSKALSYFSPIIPETPVLQSPDSKIRVHALTCMIALLLVRIAHKLARANGFEHGAQRMLELLSSVNAAILLYPKSTKAVRVRCSISKEQEVLLTALDCQVPHSM
jgi:hypothetical protein